MLQVYIQVVKVASPMSQSHASYKANIIKILS